MHFFLPFPREISYRCFRGCQQHFGLPFKFPTIIFRVKLFVHFSLPQPGERDRCGAEPGAVVVGYHEGWFRSTFYEEMSRGCMAI